MAPTSSASRRSRRSTKMEIVSTSTTPPSTPTSTIARENSGPFSSSLAASTDSTTISLMQARMPTIRNGSAKISWERREVRTAYSSSTKMKISSRPSSSSSMIVVAGMDRSRSMRLTCATISAADPAIKTTAIAQ